MSHTPPRLSVVVPVHNEVQVLEMFHAALMRELANISGTHEVIYVDDGSTDGSYQLLKQLTKASKESNLIKLSRNFGKEVATTAGIQRAQGDATLMIDADGQHPVQYIAEFVAKWQAGAKVVVGVRQGASQDSAFKKLSSRLFYRIFNHYTGKHMVPDSTDFRLIDRQVREQFSALSERNRMTRGLIDWLGYTQAYVPFVAAERAGGHRSYSFRKLAKLAVDSVISLSTSPLYIAAYAGVAIMLLAVLLGGGMLINVMTGDPLGLDAEGGAYVLVLVLFLVGLMLTSQGIIGLYLSHIHAETQNRPLYVIEEESKK